MEYIISEDLVELRGYRGIKANLGYGIQKSSIHRGVNLEELKKVGTKRRPKRQK